MFCLAIKIVSPPSCIVGAYLSRVGENDPKNDDRLSLSPSLTLRSRDRDGKAIGEDRIYEGGEYLRPVWLTRWESEGKSEGIGKKEAKKRMIPRRCLGR